MVQRAVHVEKLSYCYADEDFALGLYGRVVIVVWFGETKVGAVAKLTACIADCSGRYPGGVALLQVIEQTATPPGAATRRSLAQMHGEHAQRILRSALVCTRSGFSGAAVRMVMTGVAMLRPPAFEHELFASVPEAIAWLEKGLAEAQHFPAGGLRAAVESLRKAAKIAETSDAPEPFGARRKPLPRV